MDGSESEEVEEKGIMGECMVKSLEEGGKGEQNLGVIKCHQPNFYGIVTCMTLESGWLPLNS